MPSEEPARVQRTQQEWLADGLACFEAAKRYLGWGWSAVPLCPPDHVGVGKHHGGACDSPGKTPLIGWKAYQTKQPALGDLETWWKQWPNANVGIVMGTASQLIGVDLEGESGRKKLIELAGELASSAMEFVTPGGGHRLLFRVPTVKEYRIAFEQFSQRDEFRVLGQGSQTVAPPSRHPKGGYYRWISPTPPATRAT